MAPVRRLPDTLINQIAAGEVVERPASVVKELVENALDAGARRIEIAIRGAGQELIGVVDDGAGMTPEDCLLALERHATSKLEDEAGLAAIDTLGFRGEALPAIFSVSRLSLFTRPAEAARGFLVVGQGGVVMESGPADGPPGTAVEVRDLFFNTPARAKFLKSAAVEQAAIVRVVTQLALAQPGVHVRLTAGGGRALVNAAAAATLRERVGALYGFGLAATLLTVTADAGSRRLACVVGPPALARTHRDDIHLLVNGRVVRDTLLVQALLDAYRPLLVRDRFPLAVLELALDPGEVDVNVHPAKSWVRFRHPREVASLVRESVGRVLRQAEGAPRPASGLVSTPAAPAEPWAGPSLDGGTQAALFGEAVAGYGDDATFGRVVGQIEDTFIVAHTADEVLFVDQHVAHERVLFERLMRDLAAGTLPSQELLLPVSVELAPARARALGEMQPELARLGFSLEGFGGSALLLRAVPAELPPATWASLLDDLAREVVDEGGRGNSPVLERLGAFVACRAAIKANQPLDRAEMARLLAELARTMTPYYCPHGRPIVSRVALGEIKRELRRTW